MALPFRGFAATWNDGVVEARGFQPGVDTFEDCIEALSEIGFDPDTVAALTGGPQNVSALRKNAEVEGALPIPDEPMDLNAADAEALYNEAQRRFSLFGNARHLGATLPLIARISRYNDDGTRAV